MICLRRIDPRVSIQEETRRLHTEGNMGKREIEAALFFHPVDLEENSESIQNTEEGLRRDQKRVEKVAF
jgi:hypothetical protein